MVTNVTAETHSGTAGISSVGTTKNSVTTSPVQSGDRKTRRPPASMRDSRDILNPSTGVHLLVSSRPLRPQQRRRWSTPSSVPGVNVVHTPASVPLSAGFEPNHGGRGGLPIQQIASDAEQSEDERERYPNPCLAVCQSTVDSHARSENRMCYRCQFQERTEHTPC